MTFADNGQKLTTVSEDGMMVGIDVELWKFVERKHALTTQWSRSQKAYHGMFEQAS